MIKTTLNQKTGYTELQTVVKKIAKSCTCTRSDSTCASGCC